MKAEAKSPPSMGAEYQVGGEETYDLSGIITMSHMSRTVANTPVTTSP